MFPCATCCACTSMPVSPNVFHQSQRQGPSKEAIQRWRPSEIGRRVRAKEKPNARGGLRREPKPFREPAGSLQAQDPPPGVPVANPIQLAVDRESGDAAARC